MAYTYFLYRIAGVVFLAKYRSHAAAGIRTRLPTRVVLISRRPISFRTKVVDSPFNLGERRSPSWRPPAPKSHNWL